MANRVKTISKYSGSAWGTEVPIGADATNVDMTSNPSDYDSSSSETSKTLIGTNDVKVISSDTDLTAWGKFNRFRRRVSNKFADYFATANVKTAYQTTGADGDVYSTSLLNSYFSNVIGYTGSSAPTAGSVASQLESLNSNVPKKMEVSFTTKRIDLSNTGTAEIFNGYYIIFLVLDQSGTPTYSHFCPFWWDNITVIQAYYFSTAAAAKCVSRAVDIGIFYYNHKYN